MGRQHRNRATSTTAKTVQMTPPEARAPVEREEKEESGGTEMTRASEINAAHSFQLVLEENGVRILKLEHGATFTYRTPEEMQAVQAMIAGRQPAPGSSRSVGRVRPGATEIDALFVVDRPTSGVSMNFPVGRLWFFPRIAEPLPLWSSSNYEEEVGRIQKAWEEWSASAFAEFLTSLDPAKAALRVTTGEEDQPRFLLPFPTAPTSLITGKRIVLEHTQSSNIRYKLPLLEKKLMNLGIREVARRGENHLDREKVTSAAIRAVSLVVFSSSALDTFRAEAQKFFTTWDTIAGSGSPRFPILSTLVQTGRLAVFFVKPALIRLMEDVKEIKSSLRESLEKLAGKVEAQEETLQQLVAAVHSQGEILKKHGQILERHSQILERVVERVFPSATEDSKRHEASLESAGGDAQEVTQDIQIAGKKRRRKKHRLALPYSISSE